MGGSVIKDKRDGKWHVSIYWQGQRHRVFSHPHTGEPFYSKKSADKQLARIRTEIDEGSFQPKSWLPDSPLSISVYATYWLGTLDVTSKTLTGYRTAVNRYMSVFFGNKDIRHIRYNDIVAFKNWIPLTDKGKYNTINVLKKMMRDAWRNEDIVRVPPFPVLSYELPEIESLEFDQQEKVLEHIPERDRPIFYFMQEYGVRPGEARALKKDCIKDGQVIIRRTFSENTLRETTKTGDRGKRVFEITAFFQSVLENMTPNLSPFVFVRADGKPYTLKNLNAIFHKARKKAEMGHIKMYNAFRHSLGCQLLEQGEDLDLVRQQLGHVKTDMTRRYAKRTNSKLTEALNRRRKVIDFRQEIDRRVN